MSVIITNTYGKDLVFKLSSGADSKELPEEITIKDGDTYDVPEEKAAEFLKWYMSAVLVSDGSNSDETTDTTDTGDTVGEDGGTASTTAPVTNDRDFDVEIKYVENGEEKTIVVKSGESVDVPEDLAEDIKKQIADAETPEDKKADNTDATASENKALDEKEAALNKREAALAEKEAEANFKELLNEGKVVPAQKESFMTLAKAKGAVAMSEGKSISVDSALAEFLQNAPKHSLLNEDGESGEADEPDETEITEEEKALADVFGNSEDDLKKVKQEEGE